MDKLLASHRLRLYRQALRILGNPQDAEDALQEALFHAACHLHQFEGRSQFSTWLTRIVINTALMVRRSSRYRRETPLEDWLSNDEGQVLLEIADLRPDPEQVCSSSEIAALVNEELNLLPPALRSAFQLCHIEGLSCVEAGRSLGIGVAAMKSRVGRARQRLAANLINACRGYVCKTECEEALEGRTDDLQRSKFGAKVRGAVRDLRRSFSNGLTENVGADFSIPKGSSEMPGTTPMANFDQNHQLGVYS